MSVSGAQIVIDIHTTYGKFYNRIFVCMYYVKNVPCRLVPAKTMAKKRSYTLHLTARVLGHLYSLH